jgi:hypothetical protein
MVMKAGRTSETSASFYDTTRRIIPEDILILTAIKTWSINNATKKLTPWRQNPKVHRHIHNSPPLAPILSQLNPLILPASLPKIHSDPILLSTPRSSKCVPKLFSPLPCVPHALPTPFSLTSSA